jgi:hypothetical protein
MLNGAKASFEVLSVSLNATGFSAQASSCKMQKGENTHHMLHHSSTETWEEEKEKQTNS